MDAKLLKSFKLFLKLELSCPTNPASHVLHPAWHITSPLGREEMVGSPKLKSQSHHHGTTSSIGRSNGSLMLIAHLLIKRSEFWFPLYTHMARVSSEFDVGCATQLSVGFVSLTKHISARALFPLFLRLAFFSSLHLDFSAVPAPIQTPALHPSLFFSLPVLLSPTSTDIQSDTESGWKIWLDPSLTSDNVQDCWQA